jgi:hypothetical protein
VYTTFMGINISSGKRAFSYAALDLDLKLRATGQGDLHEVLAFAAGQSSAIIGVNAPSHLYQGEIKKETVQMQLEPIPEGMRLPLFRVCEYQLTNLGFETLPTPGKLHGCRERIRFGFQLYENLQQLNYDSQISQDAERCYIEVHSEAGFWALLGKLPLTAGTLEGRLQRQLILYDLKLPVPDPMEFFEEITRYRLQRGILPMQNIYTNDELNALMAAYVAWLATMHPEKTKSLGTEVEGIIYLPTPVPHLEEPEVPAFPFLSFKK